MYLQNKIELENTLISWQTMPEIESIFLFGGDLNKPSSTEIAAILKLNKKPLMGGFFPEIIADGQRKKEGFLIIPIYEKCEVIALETSENHSLSSQIENWIANCPLEIGSVFCFVNALWSEKKELIPQLYDALGPFVNYVGGGTGSLSFKSFPSVFANQKVIENGAVVGAMEKNMSIGVAHGWHSISQPIKVTKTNGNTIVSLNWKPAFEVYKEIVDNHSEKEILKENFFDIAKSYPLGLVKLDDEMTIRDPYSTEDGTLTTVDEVPEGEYIRVMHGNIDSLLEGAKSAIIQASNQSENDFTQLCIDCISRVLFMQEEFSQELMYLNQKQKANGILSIGEIANPTNAALELFNKTVVVSQWKNKF